MSSAARRDEVPDSRHREVRRAIAALVVAAVLQTAAACGDSSDRSAAPQSDPPASVSASPTGPGPTLTIDPLAPLTQKVRSAFYQPFTFRLPAGWTSVLRDIAAYQVYTGNEEYEITFDHTYTDHESVAEAIGRLRATAGLDAGPPSPVMIGDRKGVGFDARSDAAVRFEDSGFHTNEPGRLHVYAVPADDGSTITVFLTAGADPRNGMDTLEPLARRIFETVRWR